MSSWSPDNGCSKDWLVNLYHAKVCRWPSQLCNECQMLSPCQAVCMHMCGCAPAASLASLLYKNKNTTITPPSVDHVRSPWSVPWSVPTACSPSRAAQERVKSRQVPRHLRHPGGLLVPPGHGQHGPDVKQRRDNRTTRSSSSSCGPRRSRPSGLSMARDNLAAALTIRRPRNSMEAHDQLSSQGYCCPSAAMTWRRAGHWSRPKRKPW